MPEENNRPADVVLGVPDFTTADVSEELERSYPDRVHSGGWVYSDGTRLFVSDWAYNRVMIWNKIPTTNFAPADVVLGQPDFDLREPKARAGRSGLNFPGPLTSDGKRLIVGDRGNNRVLIWNTIPTENGQPADVVLGQPDFNSTEPGGGRTGFGDPGPATDGKRLYVIDTHGRRVLIWNNIPTQNNQPADLVLGQLAIEYPEDGLPELGPAVRMGPGGVSSDGEHLFVVDVDHNRVLVWNTIPTQNGQPADVVLGQPDFELTRRRSINRDGLFMPAHIVLDGQHLWVGEVKFSDRVVRFSIPKPRAVILKTPTDIGANSMMLSWSRSTLEDFARYEVHGSTEPGFTPSAGTLLTTITDAATISYTASGLSPGTTHYFKIRTYDAAGSYGDSVQRYATTLGEPPAEEELPAEVNLLLIGGAIGAILVALLVVIALKRGRGK